MSEVSGKTKFWTKGFVISFSLLVLSALFVVLLLLNKILFQISWVQLIYDIIYPWFSLIFYEYSILVYGIMLIGYVCLFVLYVLGYNIAKSKHLAGSILYVFSLFGFVLITILAMNYAYIGILFNRTISLNTKLMFILLFVPAIFAFDLILYLLNIDYLTFLKDLLKSRKTWKKRPKYEIRIEGNITHVNIETDDFIFTPVPMLIVAKYLQTKGFSVAWFIRGAFNHLFSLLTTYLVGWPRSRNKIFRFLGMKIGKNCHISQKAVPDPLLPELIEFKDGSGCGIGVKLLTHNVMKLKHGSFSFGPITVCENARIGAYSLIMPGVTIGEGSIIGANSVVTEDIPPFSIAAGAPAKVIRILDENEREIVNQDF